MFKLATGLGISFSDYYKMTPYELNLAIQGHAEQYENKLEMYCIATKVAIFNALKGKNHRVFNKKDQNKKVNTEKKKQDLQELKSIFT